MIPCRRLVTIVVLLAIARMAQGSPADDLETDAPLPPEEAASTMLVPEGFRVSLFAGEPDVKQPIAFCIDDRGRLWVAEAYNYPIHGTQPGDRILIFEDTDGDGRFDRRTVFYDQLNYVTGLEVGFGGVWVVSPPFFYFIPDRNYDDLPDGPPEVLLDGFGTHDNAHNLANGLAWGPDGWLYGTHGRTNWSLLGKPGTSEAERQRFDGGVYRYHPVRHQWEPYADGTTNPWGIDWDDFGNGFICNCVNPHLFQVIQGAHYEPWRNRKSSEFAYQRIPTIADHLHFLGESNIRAGIGSTEELEAGGGHAHCGTMVYLGDSWPERFRNTVFTNNIHGRRINNDVLHRAGSGYSASHGPDLMIAKDPWFMGVTLQYGPDGGVFVSDWSDTGECHSITNTRRHTGRIYKISYGESRQQSVDLRSLGDLQLVQLQLHRNDWFVRHARRLLQERASAGQDLSRAGDRLHQMLRDQQDETRQLRALWALHVMGHLSEELLLELLDHQSQYVQAWAVQLLCESRDVSDSALRHLERLAHTTRSPLVRLYLASALQRLPLENRWGIAETLAGYAEDAADSNLPLMIWYGVQALVDKDMQRFVKLVGSSRIPLLRQHIARRIASRKPNGRGLQAVLQLIATTSDSRVQSDGLVGVLAGLEGKRRVEMPEAWSDAYASLSRHPVLETRDRALQLSLVFDDPRAHELLGQRALNPGEQVDRRTDAIAALVARRAEGVDELLMRLLADPRTQQASIRSLAEFDHSQTSTAILQRYAELNSELKQDAIQTLASRPHWALELLAAMETNVVATKDVSAYAARQMLSLGDENVTAKLSSVWGEIQSSAGERRQLIEEYRQRLTPGSIRNADRQAGAEIFAKRCANCHRLFDLGEFVGPDLTGAQRHNIDYLLENLLDPNALVANDYLMEVLETTTGRVVTGLVVSESANSVTIQTVNEKVIVPIDEIDERRKSVLSVMPEGLLQEMSIQEVRDLFLYLKNPR